MFSSNAASDQTFHRMGLGGGWFLCRGHFQSSTCLTPRVCAREASGICPNTWKSCNCVVTGCFYRIGAEKKYRKNAVHGDSRMKKSDPMIFTQPVVS